MKIPDDKIDEIREATDIVEIVSQYVTLKKRGKSFLGLCPFHAEKTPSFSVDPVRGFFHCFGCGAGGNVFTFVMQMERVGFPEAVRSLAEKAGIPLPKFQRDDATVKETETLYRANQFATSYFQKCLTQSEGGKKALAYLQARDFSLETIKAFQIGYAPDIWDGLLSRADSERLQPDILRKAGLVIPRKDGQGYYDRFRGRIMFPIINPSGRIVGFGGRVLNGDAKSPKYVNSPETRIYQKSRILYGLFHSKSGIRRRDKAILVEGYTDVLRLHQDGFDYGAATSGTALTQEQARLLSRYTKNIVLVFDGDSAGFKAALRGLEVLVEAGLTVRIAPLPPGTDPDSFLREQKPSAMEERLEAAQTFTDFQISQFRESGKLSTPGDRAAVARTILQTVGRIRDPLERNLMIKDLAEKLGIDESLLNRQLRQTRRSGKPPEQGVPPRHSVSSARESAEETLLKLLMEDGMRWAARIFQFVKPEQLRKKEAREFLTHLYQDFLRGDMPDSRTVIHRFNDNPRMARYVTGLLSEAVGEVVDRDQLAFDCVLSLRKEDVQVQIRQAQERIKQACAKGEDDSEFMRSYLALKGEMARIEKEMVKVWSSDTPVK